MFCLILSFKTCFKSNFLLKKIKTKKKQKKTNKILGQNILVITGRTFDALDTFPIVE